MPGLGSYDYWASNQNSGNGGTNSGGGSGGNTPPPNAPSQSALDILNQWFEENLGISQSAEIVQIIHDAWVKGYTANDIDLFMPDIEKTQAFKNAFPGYDEAKKKGYIIPGYQGVGQYRQIRAGYMAILENSGLPAGFYDDPSDFGQFIANGVSVSELESRVGMAVRTAQQIDPTMRNLMAKFYGLTTGDVAAYFLDPDRALPTIERQYRTAGVATWAARYGLDTSSMARYEGLVDKGVTEDQAASGYANVKALSDYVGRSGGVYGESYSQADAENDVFFNDQTKRRRIIANEQATFGGSSQGSTGSAKRTSY